MIRPLVFLTLIFSLSACSLFTPNQNAKTVSIHWEEPQKLYFSGKGAGAGMALMSTMGPMGMAIGVAIDEGIGKDIAKAQAATGVSIQELVSTSAPENSFTWKTQQDAEHADFVIKRIEFKLVRGGKNDATAVHIKLVDQRDEVERTINYPDDIANHTAANFPLEILKKDGVKTNQLLIEAFEKIMLLERP